MTKSGRSAEFPAGRPLTGAIGGPSTAALRSAFAEWATQVQAGDSSEPAGRITVLTCSTTGDPHSLGARDAMAAEIAQRADAAALDSLWLWGDSEPSVAGSMLALARLNCSGVFVDAGQQAGESDPVASVLSASFEALGLSVLGTSRLSHPLLWSSGPATALVGDVASVPEVVAAAARAMNTAAKSREIITRGAIENALTLATAIDGGSDVWLHYLDIARVAGLRWTWWDCQRIASRVPVLCQPAMTADTAAFAAEGGVPRVLKILMDHGLIHGDCITLTGRSLATELAGTKASGPDSSDGVRSFDQPLSLQGRCVLLTGNLAPAGAVAQVPLGRPRSVTGTARVYDGEATAVAGIVAGEVEAGDVLVVRYQGLHAGAGMPRLQACLSALAEHHLEGAVAVVTDGRLPACASGIGVGQVLPEAADGGPIAVLQTGDRISIDSSQGLIRCQVTDEQLALRRMRWKPPSADVTARAKPGTATWRR